MSIDYSISKIDTNNDGFAEILSHCGELLRTTGIGSQDLLNIIAQTLLVQLRINTSGGSGGLTDTQLRASAVPVTGPLTDTQLRATAVPISATSLPLPTSASTEATLGLIKAKTDNLDVLLSTRTKPADTQAISAVSLPLPSGAATSANQLPAGHTVDPTDRATRLVGQVEGRAASGVAKAGNPSQIGGVFNTTQPTVTTGQVVEAQFTARGAQIVAAGTEALNVTVNTALPTGANVIGALSANQSVNNAQWIGSVAPTVGQKTMANSLPVTLASDQSVQPAVAEVRASTLWVTATAAVNTASTASLPAAGAGLFHYITRVQLTKLYSVIGVASGAGVIITTTNLPGSPAFTTEQLASAAGTAPNVIDWTPATPFKSSVANTATTFVAPAQLQTIWRWNVSYFTAV